MSFSGWVSNCLGHPLQRACHVEETTDNQWVVAKEAPRGFPGGVGERQHIFGP
jgi:hypothetical protein